MNFITNIILIIFELCVKYKIIYLLLAIGFLYILYYFVWIFLESLPYLIEGFFQNYYLLKTIKFKYYLPIILPIIIFVFFYGCIKHYQQNIIYQTECLSLLVSIYCIILIIVSCYYIIIDYYRLYSGPTMHIERFLIAWFWYLACFGLLTIFLVNIQSSFQILTDFCGSWKDNAWMQDGSCIKCLDHPKIWCGHYMQFQKNVYYHMLLNAMAISQVIITIMRLIINKKINKHK